MHPDLQHTLDALDAATGGLSASELAWHPAGKWSAAEILEHLLKTYSGTAYILNRCLETGQPKARPDTVRQRVFAFVVVELGYLPSGQQAPEFTRPAGMPADQVVSAARAALGSLDEVAARAEARFGGAAKLASSPILGAFNLRQWRRFHLVHTRHHMKQIARLRKHM